MPTPSPADQGPVRELDVRTLRGPEKYPPIAATYAALPVGGWFVLVDDHDPAALRDEFEIDHPGSHGWEYVHRGPQDWRVRITKRAATPLPRILTHTDRPATEAGDPDATGVVWKLQARARDLDSNIIALPPDGTIGAHTGPEVDVLIHVLAGTGQLMTELSTVDLAAGALVWLPRRSRRRFTAGPDGLRYLTVHQRRQALALDTGRV